MEGVEGTEGGRIGEYGILTIHITVVKSRSPSRLILSSL